MAKTRAGKKVERAEAIFKSLPDEHITECVLLALYDACGVNEKTAARHSAAAVRFLAKSKA